MMRRIVSRPMAAAVSSSALVAKAALRQPVRAAADAVPPRRLLYSNDSFLSGSSAMYMEGLYHDWKQDPASVDPSWAAIFEKDASAQDLEKPLLDSPIRVMPVESDDAVQVKQSLEDCDRLTWMIQAFEDRGHLLAATDPLNYDDDPTQRIPSRKYRDVVRLDLDSFGFHGDAADRVVRVGCIDTVGGVMNTASPPMTIRQLHTLLTKLYCGKVGYELLHIPDAEARRFIRSRVENTNDTTSPVHRVLTKAEKLQAWNDVASAVFFEDFFKRKYSTQKRFGCDGAESMVLGLRALLKSSAAYGVEKINLGMAHRGRLNVLCHVIGKPFEVILKEFIGVTGPELEPFQMQSDVKYHLGARSTVELAPGVSMRTEMLCNPSHLEAVNPFVEGYTRAEQVSQGAEGWSKVMPIEIHGDAAFSGQGVAFESMCICEVGEQNTGGAIHVVCNNQIGFTTDPKHSRSSAYSTDLGRAYGCPIFHVNGDSPEDVVRVFELAADFRARFHKSVVIDLVCYRRYGHNENDDPSITQPLMYERIRSVPNVFNKYSNQLVEEGVITRDQITAKSVEMKEHFGSFTDRAAAVNYAKYLKEAIPPQWRDMKHSDELGKVTLGETAIEQSAVDAIATALETVPSGFTPHPKLKAVLDRRNDTIRKGDGIDWGTAEALAFGSLLLDGHNVRIMGEDVQRGTFAQRHAVIHDANNNNQYAPLAHIAKEQGDLNIANSPLSEYGMLGFAGGYSLVSPNNFCMWEAQYGDFANGATIVFDQFLSSGESKWNQQQSLVVSLPHGYDGKGPEHSSGRLERFLQMSNEDADGPIYTPAERAHRVNWEIVYPTTPAQYFHVLRRHMKRDFRKPLVIFFSKQYLRAPNVSSLAEITSGNFQAVIPDPSTPPAKAKRLIMCSGQLYHALNKHRETNNITDAAIVRVEELSPFPMAEVQQVLDEYKDAILVWAQEEPKNMGPWEHVEPRLTRLTGGEREILYAGRSKNSSPSTGHMSRHLKEQERIMEVAFTFTTN